MTKDLGFVQSRSVLQGAASSQSKLLCCIQRGLAIETRALPELTRISMISRGPWRNLLDQEIISALVSETC